MSLLAPQLLPPQVFCRYAEKIVLDWICYSRFAAAKHAAVFVLPPLLLRCRYAETVIHRIFYSLNRSGNGRLTLREIKR